MISQQTVVPKLPTIFEDQPLCKPIKDNPAGAEKFVRSIFEQKLHNLSLVAAELTPLFGFGPGSNHDVNARSRSQALFVSPVMQDPFGEFATLYLNGDWSLPIASWHPTITLTTKQVAEKAWVEWSLPITPRNSTNATEKQAKQKAWITIPDRANVDEFYARFLIRALQRLRCPEKPDNMLDWLRRANDEDACWVLFHALMYLQLEVMHFNKTHAPFRNLVSHYVNKVPGTECFLDYVRNLMALRRLEKLRSQSGSSEQSTISSTSIE
ncbi:hypothetical protein EV127DRAFT_414735 [Xylaria flabelliformis]|nr:hypothetical protein EV127DRAFT_414735 [Xylaria flabelliformis]